MKTSRRTTADGLRVLLIGLLLLLHVGCKGDDATRASAEPEIVGCSSVLYQGVTYTTFVCAQGVSSATVEGSQNGQSYCFDITCEGGCIFSVSVCASGPVARRAPSSPVGEPHGSVSRP